MTYDIYHDECKADGYWHGFLFVPRQTRSDLLALLRRARENTGYFNELHYVEIGKSVKPHHDKYILAEAWTSIGCSSLQQHKFNTHPPKVILGRNPRTRSDPEYRILPNLLKCKFVLFRENDTHRNMYAGMDQLKRIETTFRMGIKGGVHKLFNEFEPIQIGDVFMDGDEQYLGVFGRPFDVSRTLQRFASEMRGFVSFVDGPKLIPQRSDHHRAEKDQRADDSHLLQLCDVLIGGFRFHACQGDYKHPRFHISFRCKDLLEHEQTNTARMTQSRYRNGFSLQQAWLGYDEWNFAPLAPAAADQPSLQEELFQNP
jgi:hypothetical protein